MLMCKYCYFYDLRITKNLKKKNPKKKTRKFQVNFEETFLLLFTVNF